MIEPVIKSIEPLNGTGFQDWKSKFEMAVKDTPAGTPGVHQNSETSENEILVNTSKMEHQTASQVYFSPLDIVFFVPVQNSLGASRCCCSMFAARTVGNRDHLI